MDVLFDATQRPEPDFIAEQLEDYFGAIDGAIFQTKSDEFVVLAKLGPHPDINVVKSGISRKFPDHKCSVAIRDISRNGLQTIEIRIKSAQTPVMKRSAEKKFFVIDDDLFIRKTLGHILSAHGTAFEFSDGAHVEENYMKEEPDIVFIDLHLPDGSGIDVMNRILLRWPAANIVIISADSTADNVLQAQAKGSKGFLGKPPSKEKVQKIIKSLSG